MPIMFSGAKRTMNRCIEAISAWLAERPKTKQWLWFAALWLGGLLTVMSLAYPIKLAMQSI